MKLLPLLLLLTGCSTLSYEARCVSPERSEHFVLKEINSYNIKDSTLILKEADGSVVFYFVPAGSACKLSENTNND